MPPRPHLARPSTAQPQEHGCAVPTSCTPFCSGTAASSSGWQRGCGGATRGGAQLSPPAHSTPCRWQEALNSKRLHGRSSGLQLADTRGRILFAWFVFFFPLPSFWSFFLYLASKRILLRYVLYPRT